MFGLTSSFFLVEIIVGYVTNSMALVADSFHMLSDIAALIIAYMSVRMAPKSWDKSTYGWARAEVLGALVNAVFLVSFLYFLFIFFGQSRANFTKETICVTIFASLNCVALSICTHSNDL